VPTTPPKLDRSTPIPYKEEDVVPHSVKTVLNVPKDEVQLHFDPTQVSGG
jgi:hypothetical protein